MRLASLCRRDQASFWIRGASNQILVKTYFQKLLCIYQNPISDAQKYDIFHICPNKEDCLSYIQERRALQRS